MAWGYRDQLKIAKRLIAEFPDYYAIGEKILYVERELRDRKDKEGFRRFLRELILTHPGTRVSEEAENFLNKLHTKSLEEWLYPKWARKKRVEVYRRKNQK